MHWQDKSVQRNGQPGAWTYACLFIANATEPCLGRNAPVVDAGAADELALDDRSLASGIAEPHRERRAGLSGADDDRVEGLRHEVPAPSV